MEVEVMMDEVEKRCRQGLDSRGGRKARHTCTVMGEASRILLHRLIR